MIRNLCNGPTLMMLAFFLWGITPLFYYFLSDCNLTDLLIYRILCSIPLLLIMRLLLHDRTPLLKVWRDKKSLFLCLATGGLMVISWTAFVYSLTHHIVLDASLAYFLTPLIVVVLGRCFLNEKITVPQSVAVFLGMCGLSYQLSVSQDFPVLAIVMALSFALYVLFRKFIHYDAMTSLCVETLWALPVVLILLFYTGALSHLANRSTIFLYILTAPVTCFPLMIFSLALKHTSLVITGLAQYIEPSLQFLIATMIFGEIINASEIICFFAIWLGLCFSLFESIVNRKHSGKA